VKNSVRTFENSDIRVLEDPGYCLDLIEMVIMVTEDSDYRNRAFLQIIGEHLHFFRVSGLGEIAREQKKVCSVLEIVKMLGKPIVRFPVEVEVSRCRYSDHLMASLPSGAVSTRTLT
jgi:hypothetical protein